MEMAAANCHSEGVESPGVARGRQRRLCRPTLLTDSGERPKNLRAALFLMSSLQARMVREANVGYLYRAVDVDVDSSLSLRVTGWPSQ